MALHIPLPPGYSQMLKDGARSFSGTEEAVSRNITACKAFATTIRSSYGPNGMNKMVINYLGKQFVTSDAASIIRELDVEHPAAKIVVLASQMQEEEIGDGTNFVIILAGALLECAEELISLGITTSEIAEGYEQGLARCLEILPKLVCYEIKDHRDKDAVKVGIRAAIMSKQFGQEDVLGDLIARACVSIPPGKNTFNVDNIRVCKILGSGLNCSEVLHGMVFKRLVEGNVTSAKDAKIVMYSCPVDISRTETKGTVLIRSAQELLDFSREEESLLERQIKAIADSGVTVIVAGGKVGDMALHYVNQYKLMVVRLTSKFDMERLSRAVGATTFPQLVIPTVDDLGFCDDVHVEEIGDTMVVVFSLAGTDSKLSTIVVRGATDSSMDDVERAIDDGVNTFRCMERDGRFLPGAGAVELELAKDLAVYADTLPGIEQYSLRKFGKALEFLPKALADNSGVNTTAVLSHLFDAHANGLVNEGFDVDCVNATGSCDVVTNQIFDLYLTKVWAMKFAVEAACTILRVDHIIMAKRAGGPKKTERTDDD